jgi:hypothetical protein
MWAIKGLKAPNYNTQITNKFQSGGSMFKTFEILNFGHWDLFGI